MPPKNSAQGLELDRAAFFHACRWPQSRKQTSRTKGNIGRDWVQEHGIRQPALVRRSVNLRIHSCRSFGSADNDQRSCGTLRLLCFVPSRFASLHISFFFAVEAACRVREEAKTWTLSLVLPIISRKKLEEGKGRRRTVSCLCHVPIP